ncbi:disintegrin and metalloproteinase domain-containing protein [Elysia marginata]|uniref:Disintegrin and metalloproteinase domain-containing protein n=1 Tax=Elysia marginata TaxID=1093978 RepID=A0AAV4J8Z8_9GAST|nr:disintegrin and metalloproteinase domain-containing protein [Elysia marginata]
MATRASARNIAKNKRVKNITMSGFCKNQATVHLGMVLALGILASIALDLCTGSPHSIFKHFETLKPHHILRREKRATSGVKGLDIIVHFLALQKHFKLLLTPGARVLHPSVEAKLVDSTGTVKPLSFEDNRFYFGTLNDQAIHEVVASETGGMWMIHIHTPGEFYGVEPMWFYDGNANHTDMIVYREQDIRINNTSSEVPFCKVISLKESFSNAVNKKTGLTNSNGILHQVVSSMYKKGLSTPRAPTITRTVKDFLKASYEEKKSLFNRTRKPKRRNKREHGHRDAPTECELLAVADYSLYKGVGARNPSSIVQTLVHIYSLVDKIFRDTDFGKGFGRGYGIALRGILIHTNYSDPETLTHYNSANLSMSAEDILRAMTREFRFFPYCVVHLTTQRDTGKTLGLASRASDEENWDNGICAGRHQYYTRNVGTSTVIGPTKMVQPLKSYSLIVAHEIGHNWGARHDPTGSSPLSCNPSTSQGGKFLMWAYLLHGKDPNANKFSPCSLEDIRAVLRSRAHKCFLTKSVFTEICGNGILDSSEECDPGFEHRYSDPCCQHNCGLRRGAQCSFRNAPCCTPDCTIAPPTQKCYPDGKSSLS